MTYPSGILLSSLRLPRQGAFCSTHCTLCVNNNEGTVLKEHPSLFQIALKFAANTRYTPFAAPMVSTIVGRNRRQLKV